MNSVEAGSLFWRLLSSPSGQPLLADRGVRVPRLSSPATERGGRALRGGRREARVRLASEPRAGDLELRFSPRTRRAGRRARLGRRRLRLEGGKGRIENDLAGRGATSRVTGADFADGDAAPRLRHVPGAHRAETTSDFAFKGALRDEASAVWRGMIRVEKDAQKTNAYQENRNLLLSQKAHADSIPASRSSRTTSAARTARRSARSTASSSSTRWPAASRAARPSG